MDKQSSYTLLQGLEFELIPVLETHFQPKFVNMLGAALEKYISGKDFREYQHATEALVNSMGERLGLASAELTSKAAGLASAHEKLRATVADNKTSAEDLLRE